MYSSLLSFKEAMEARIPQIKKEISDRFATIVNNLGPSNSQSNEGANVNNEGIEKGDWERYSAPRDVNDVDVNEAANAEKKIIEKGEEENKSGLRDLNSEKNGADQNQSSGNNGSSYDDIGPLIQCMKCGFMAEDEEKYFRRLTPKQVAFKRVYWQLTTPTHMRLLELAAIFDMRICDLHFMKPENWPPPRPRSYTIGNGDINRINNIVNEAISAKKDEKVTDESILEEGEKHSQGSSSLNNSDVDGSPARSELKKKKKKSRTRRFIAGFKIFRRRHSRDGLEAGPSSRKDE